MLLFYTCAGLVYVGLKRVYIDDAVPKTDAAWTTEEGANRVIRRTVKQSGARVDAS